jgi:thiol-disulfide isomerase/thioredoxin
LEAVVTGIVILGVAVVVAVGFGLFRRATDGRFETDQVSETWGRVRDAMPEESLGERATLVQFSSAFCAPCRTTRVVLADIADREHGVRHLEIDAEMHLDLVRALDVRRTPTTLVLDSRGHEVARAAGAPQRGQVLAALPAGAAS